MLLAFSVMLAAAQPGSAQGPAATPSQPAASTQGYLTGTDLYLRCTEASQVGTTYCFAYISAVHDSVRAYEAWLNMREMCIPRGTSQSELRTIFTAYAQKYPANLTGQAASIVLDALKQRYPCAAAK